ncbi:DAK2 domain-containing protein [Sporosarcina pasteurii]|uniref:Dihydroxyacetone kinase n=1 Tax=Sporosarcina pasteurii TaxID=1474 RepID=A0A380BFD7_SPOPA|nr:DAK2 domain-containing protein [Sporosarcina pasteurii]MDS9470543.1 DAK2 domain-containing protein [Sporosarcina pasteurii]QBQ05763.1 DAK2 domain-containing protein [Sporosarcina pasteurii]SUJ00663.1 dihydroxyacetone kinase [Sporosarcina pasteurii]
MKFIDGVKFSEMVKLGAHHLYENADYVDSLNVFPVPDGDTGTNMNLSMSSGAKEIEANTVEHIGETAGALSKGLLMGARGNSGVILSQLFRGFGKAIESEAKIDGKKFADALKYGVDTAYKAVMKPVEGTILTVAKDAANAAVEKANTTDDVIEVMETVVDEAKASLDRTPELLAVLKEVGVVDSGGQGLVYVYEGFLACLKGEELPVRTDVQSMDELVNAAHHQSVQDFMSTDDIIYGYCTEFMVKFESEKLIDNPFDEGEYRQELSEFGDSLLVISDDEIAKVHIHSETPGDVLSFSQKYGSLINMKIENMRQQHEDIVGTKANDKKEKHPYAVVTVAMGSGIAELLKSVGASVVIEGGQTMNPSTQDIVKAIEDVSAERVLILPNNKNIVMAAEQAAEHLGIEAAVVPTTTVPEGLSAILAFNPEADVEVNKNAMIEAASYVKTAQVTYAVRDTSIDGIDIKKGAFMGIDSGKIVTTNPSLEDVTKSLIQKIIDDESEIITVIYGEDVSEEEATRIGDYIEEHFDHVDVELYNGKQPLYPYIISVE